MKEGLRSGNVSGKPETDEVSPGRRKRGSDVKQLSIDLNADAMQTVDYGTDECGVEDGLNGTDRKGSRIDGVDEEDSVVKKGVKEDIPVENVGRVLRSRSRMDRSGVKEVNNKVVEDEKNTDSEDGCSDENVEDVAVEQSKESDHGKVKGKRGRPRKVKGKRGRPRKAPETDETSDQEIKVKGKRGRPRKAPEIDDTSDQEMKVKGKRGRPCKVQESDDFLNEERKALEVKRGRPSKVLESDKSSDEERKVKTKRWRPCKVQESDNSLDEESNKVKGKRGRPPKVQESDEYLDEGRKKINGGRGRPPKVKKGKKRRGRPSKKMEDSDQTDDETSIGLKGKRGRPFKIQGTDKVTKNKLDKGESVNELGMKGESVNEVGISEEVKFAKQEGKTGKETDLENSMQSLREQKNSIRTRIVELLLAAGWKIEYRPRNGREYKDAVYVNPEGNTHWSVTLAYRKLKEHYEKEGDNANTSNTGFTFIPIPEDELKLLKKGIQKTRSDKNKKKPKKKSKHMNTDDEQVNRGKKRKHKLRKGRPDSAASSHGKSIKKRLKRKPLQNKQENSAARNRKQGIQNRKRCGLLVRKSVEGSERDTDGYVLYDGKRTVLSWLIDTGTVALDGKVEYMNRRKTRVMNKGKITRDGICCDCCGKVYSISKFEGHSGSETSYPFQNLYLESGNSLLQCILNSWNKQDESERRGFHFVDVSGEDPNDDTCGICGDGGDLICCDSCPSTFHQSCLDIKRFPSGKWNCVFCSCKFCGLVNKDTSQLVDNHDNHDDSAVSTLLKCSLCEEKYHQSCIPAEDAITDNSSDLFFCGKKCQQIFERLLKLLGVKHELDEGYTWSLICRAAVDSDLSLKPMRQKVECNAKLAVALLVMDECFLPMTDHRSGINLIHNIVYNFGSNFNRLNYGGFFMAILEKDDEIISAASIRIHGSELAEMPFIGTRYMYRRQGMCRRLLTGVETALCSLNVERLVIPAITELKDTWTSVFDFKPVTASIKQKTRSMNLLMFPGVDLLQKPVLEHQIREGKVISAQGSKSSELDVNETMNEVADDSSKKRPNGFDLNNCSEESAPHDDSAKANSSERLLVGSVNDTFDATKSVNLVGVTPDVGQEDEQTAMNSLSSVGVRAEQHKDIIGDGGEVPGASRLVTVNIGSEIKSEDEHSCLADRAVDTLKRQKHNCSPDVQLGGTHDAVQGHDRGGESTHASIPPAESIASKVESEDDVKHIKVGNEVSTHLESETKNLMERHETEVKPGSCGNNGVSNPPSGSEKNAEDSKQSESGSAVAPNCSSGGGNSCAKPEAIILSNQAS